MHIYICNGGAKSELPHHGIILHTCSQRSHGTSCFSALAQFFLLFPHLKENDFYMTGEVGYSTAVAIATLELNQINVQMNDVDRVGCP